MTRVVNFISRGAIRWAVGRRAEDGQGLVEYGLIIGLIAIVVAAAVSALGTGLINFYQPFPGAF